MKQRLTQYVDLLFAGTADSEDIKQEILQNTLDRYDDLIAQGKAPEAAYSLAISGIGDVSELLRGSAQESNSGPESTQTKREYNKDSHKSAAISRAVAVAFFILCPIPLLILQNAVGLCLLLAMVAAGVGLLVLFGKGNVAAHEAKHSRSSSNRTVNGILWICGLAIYLFTSFYTGAWFITWLIFPIIGCACGLVNACFDLNKVFVNAVVRIILFGLAIALLLVILLGTCLSIYVNDFVFGETAILGGETASAGSVSAQEVQDIEIQWVSGSITIQPGDTQDIQFSESSGLRDQHKLVWMQSGDKLIIEFCKPSFSSVFISVPSKDLVITVPRDWICDELDIESVSAAIQADELQIRDADIITVSGNCDFTDCMVQNFSAETVSGKVYYVGCLETLEFDTVSADCTASLLNTPTEVDLNAVSGNMILYLPSVSGFTATLDSVSGDFTSEFPTTASKNIYQYGDGSCRITADSVSGNIQIRALQ